MVNTQWHWQEPGKAWRGCGIYHITLCQTDRSKALLGRLTDSSTATEVAVERTELGNAIVEQFLAIPSHRPEVRPLAFCLMPDHFHGVIYVTSEMQSGIMSLARGFWQGCKKVGRRYSQAAMQSPDKDEEREMGRRIQSACKDEEMWQYDPIFHEMPYVVPLAGKGQLERMINYVHGNPYRAWLKRANPDLFRMRRDIHISRAGANMTFSAMGNMFLLDWPMHQLVECSRTIRTEVLEAQKQETLRNATQGYVTISAAMNDGEREIARAVREAGFPLVILLKDGFPAPGSEHEKYFKPKGLYFEICAAGKLLLLEATKETFDNPTIVRLTQEDLRHKAEEKHRDYTPLPTSSMRYRCVALNNMGRLLAAEAADAIRL